MAYEWNKLQQIECLIECVMCIAESGATYETIVA